MVGLQVGLMLLSLIGLNDGFVISGVASRHLVQGQTLEMKGYTAATTNDAMSMDYEYSNDASVETTSSPQHFEAPSHTTVNFATSVSPLRVMFFIDGTWLYYSLFGNKDDTFRNPINRKLGDGWHSTYKVDWKNLPICVMRALQNEDKNRGWMQLSATKGQTMSASRPLEIVRACVYTAACPTAHKLTPRLQMFEEMRKAGYDVTMMDSDGENEKCVDIQLAVDMVHYATIPNTFDVAVIISGDKDYIPALIRCRQKGRRVAVASMRPFCSRAYWEMPNVKDYDMVWLDEYMDEIFVPRDNDGDFVSVDFISKIIKDFIVNSGMTSVSIRDIGRYVKRINVGERSLLDLIKNVHHGLSNFIRKSPAFELLSSNQESNVRVLESKDMQEPKWNTKEETILQKLSNIDFSIKTALYAYTLEEEHVAVGVDANSRAFGGTISVGFITAVIEDFIMQSGMPSIAIRDIGRYIKYIWVGEKNVHSEIKEIHDGLRQFLLRSPNFDLDSSACAANTYVRRQPGATVDDRAEWSDTEREVFESLPMDLHQKLETHFEFTLKDLKQTSDPQIDYNSLTVKDLKEMCKQRSLPVSGKKAELIFRLGGP